MLEIIVSAGAASIKDVVMSTMDPSPAPTFPTNAVSYPNSVVASGRSHARLQSKSSPSGGSLAAAGAQLQTICRSYKVDPQLQEEIDRFVEKKKQLTMSEAGECSMVPNKGQRFSIVECYV